MRATVSDGSISAAERPWKMAVLWLAILAPFFYLSYGSANWLAAQRSHVDAIVFDWERQIPFLAWTIIPYWSINAFYGLSVFVCSDRHELSVHGRRLLLTQLIAVACFLAFPLRFTLERPPTDGLPGFMFDALTSFDRPFNQAPSLHIALLLVLGDLYGRHIGPAARVALVAWFGLVGVSVLTTYQHHFVDIPTGLLLGAVVIWLLPWRGASPVAALGLTSDRRRLGLALRYAAGATLLLLAACSIGGAALWLLWISLSLGLVAVGYAALGPAVFAKNESGRRNPAATLLLAPYLAGAWINARLWTRHDPPAAEIVDGVWIGRMPRQREVSRLPAACLVDLCAELAAPAGLVAYRGFPSLDLVAVDAEILQAAARAVEDMRRDGPVVVTCALGYGRSAAAIAGWLVLSGREADSRAALARIRAVRPRVAVDENALSAALAGASANPASSPQAQAAAVQASSVPT